MKSAIKIKYVPLLEKSPIARTDDETELPVEQFMDREFGHGAWVRDSWCDVFVTYDPNYTGPGIGYMIVDRDRRRRTVEVLPHQVN